MRKHLLFKSNLTDYNLYVIDIINLTDISSNMFPPKHSTVVLVLKKSNYNVDVWNVT